MATEAEGSSMAPGAMPPASSMSPSAGTTVTVPSSNLVRKTCISMKAKPKFNASQVIGSMLFMKGPSVHAKNRQYGCRQRIDIVRHQGQRVWLVGLSAPAYLLRRKASGQAGSVLAYHKAPYPNALAMRQTCHTKYSSSLCCKMGQSCCCAVLRLWCDLLWPVLGELVRGRQRL